MRKLLLSLAVLIISLGGIREAAAQLPTGDEVMTRCQKLHSDGVGLIVRAKGSSKGKKIGSLQAGEKVQLGGEDNGPDLVRPAIQVEADGSYWIQIKKPLAGWVLFASKADPKFHYLIPCQE
ncbi:MAG: SH3 domain-containing protein [Chthoniobacterales bacterium]